MADTDYGHAISASHEFIIDGVNNDITVQTGLNNDLLHVRLITTPGGYGDQEYETENVIDEEGNTQWIQVPSTRFAKIYYHLQDDETYENVELVGSISSIRHHLANTDTNPFGISRARGDDGTNGVVDFEPIRVKRPWKSLNLRLFLKTSLQGHGGITVLLKGNATNQGYLYHYNTDEEVYNRFFVITNEDAKLRDVNYIFERVITCFPDMKEMSSASAEYVLRLESDPITNQNGGGGTFGLHYIGNGNNGYGYKQYENQSLTSNDRYQYATRQLQSSRFNIGEVAENTCYLYDATGVNVANDGTLLDQITLKTKVIDNLW